MLPCWSHKTKKTKHKNPTAETFKLLRCCIPCSKVRIWPGFRISLLCTPRKSYFYKIYHNGIDENPSQSRSFCHFQGRQGTVVELEASPVVVAQDAKPGLSAEPGSLIHTLEDLIELMLCGVGDPTRHGSSWVFTPEKRVYGTRHALQPVCQCFELSSTVIICCHCLRCDQHNVG